MADENPPVETVNVTAASRSPPWISTSSSAFAGKVAISASVGISNVDTNADVSTVLSVVSTSPPTDSCTWFRFEPCCAVICMLGTGVPPVVPGAPLVTVTSSPDRPSGLP